MSEAIFATNLDREADFHSDGLLDLHCHLHSAAKQPDGGCHVQKGFIDGKGLQERGEALIDLKNLP
jgi:hypothetical protein